MAHAYTQADRPLTLSTPLGRDDLLIVGMTGREAISEPFEFLLDLIAENGTVVPFDRLLGQKVGVTLADADGTRRYFHGICKSVSEGVRDPTFTAYRMEVVPEFWLLGKRARSRVFQQVSVPEILKAVLDGLDVAYEIGSAFLPRDYCVQYRETDLSFASRLMEEEGLFYYFRHSEQGHMMVVADPSAHRPALPGRSALQFAGSDVGLHDENRVTSWVKTQELRSGRYTLRDHSFEVPGQSLEATASVPESVASGKVAHRLRVGDNDKLELYDYPGGYAHRFDGVNPGGADRSGDLRHLFEDNQRTVAIRMGEESASGLAVLGSGTCRNLVSGHTFTLQGHFNADGPYVVTSVEHSAALADAYRSGGTGEFVYRNSFRCIPLALPFRPARKTPRPFVHGTQTALVVGPAGEEVFTDKYGRVKVQFFWDREGKNDANSSCWVRVGTPWAGNHWGMVHTPRIGQEVIVAFLEGDPDQPIIVGSVYNADQMPPYDLPRNKTQSGVKSRSTLNGLPSNFNEIRFEDARGAEQVYVQAERNMDTLVKASQTLSVGADRSKSVGHDETVTVGNDRSETVRNDVRLSVGRHRNETVGGNLRLSIAGARDESVGKSQTLDVKGSITITAGDQITLRCGASSLVMKKDGTITLKGMKIELSGGGSKATVDPKGVKLTGLIIKAVAEVLAQFKGGVTRVEADALLKTQAGITMMS